MPCVPSAARARRPPQSGGSRCRAAPRPPRRLPTPRGQRPSPGHVLRPGLPLRLLLPRRPGGRPPFAAALPAGGGGVLRPAGAAAARRCPPRPPRAEPRSGARGGDEGRAVRAAAAGLRRDGGGGRRVPAVAGGGGGEDDAVRVRAAAVPLRRALRGGPQAAGEQRDAAIPAFPGLWGRGRAREV